MIPDTQSPYWLRLYGKWIHLQGVKPETNVEPERAFSSLTTVDGFRYVQQAPRGPRSWELSYEYGTAAATAALESAAYGFNYSDPLARTLFLDTNSARVNMVDPDLAGKWQHVNVLPPQYVLNVGESSDDPMWQPSYVATVDDVDDWGVQRIPVRAGVTYTAVFWTVFPNPLADALTVTVNAVEVASDAIVGGGTQDNPELVTLTWTAVTDGVAVVAMHINSVPYSAGLMFYEGDCPPDYFRAGRRMPCEVAVLDPKLGVNPIWPGNCDPCDLPREQSTFTVMEVGYVASDPLMVPEA